MREKYESLPVLTLKSLAKARGLKNISTLKKSEVIELMLKEDEKEEMSSEEQATKHTVPKTESIVPVTQQSTVPEKAEEVQPKDKQAAKKSVPNNTIRKTNTRTKKNTNTGLNANFTASVNPNRSIAAGSAINNTTNTNTGGAINNTTNTNTGSAINNTTNTNTGSAINNTTGTNTGSAINNSTGTNTGSAVNNSTGITEVGAMNKVTGATTGTATNSAAGLNTNRSAQYNTSVQRQDKKENEERSSYDISQLDSGQQANGILEVLPDGYGFIRSANYLPGENDVYVSPSQIRRFNLKTGDIISGNTRVKTQQEKFSALLFLKTINGLPTQEATKRYNFEDMTPIFPNERIRLERSNGGISMRIVDMISPIGKGQRGMIVSQPKTGKTTLLKEIAKSILVNSPKMHLIILLIDERPEEVTDIREAIVGDNVEVIYSTFDELPEHHKRVSEMVMERAKRLVEHKKDVTILLDSITRLSRAYNLTVPPSGRTLSGGLDPAALHMPKKFFGAARNMREGGSLTILATALVDTGSRMDDVVFEEFKGTGNMELVLDRKLSERRVFPAIDIPKSGTRREDLLLTREEQEASYIMRKALNGMRQDDAVENIINTFVKTKNNAEFVQTVRRQKYV